jgi:CTD small phosphatase-like protein 2
MSTQQVTRQTILESIYTLRRRRSVVPLEDITNRGPPRLGGSNRPNPPLTATTAAAKSLIQGQKIPIKNDSFNLTSPIQHHSKFISTNMNFGSSLYRFGANMCPAYQLSSSLHSRRATTVTPRLHNVFSSAVRRPSLLYNSPFNVVNGIRQNYAGAAKDSSHMSSQRTLDEEEGENVVASSRLGVTSPKSQSPCPETKKSDLIVVLDMDECLIHSQFQSQMDEYLRQQEHRPKSNYFDGQDDVQVQSACESFRISLPGGDLVHVNKRPNLDDFLRTITSKYETHVFTAAMEVYASPLLDVLDPNGDMFQERYYREHCTFDPSLGVYIKDLKKALGERKGADGLNEGRVVLVDNNPMSFLANPMNGILVCNFYDDPKDDTLGALVDLLEELDKEKDVRPFLDQKFGLKDALCEAMNAPTRSSWK